MLFLKFAKFKIYQWQGKNSYSSFNDSSNRPFENHPPRGFLGKAVMKICRKFTGQHLCQSANSIKLQISVWVFSSQFADYFQNNFSKKTSRRLFLPFDTQTMFIQVPIYLRWQRGPASRKIRDCLKFSYDVSQNFYTLFWIFTLSPKLSRFHKIPCFYTISISPCHHTAPFRH